ncbi:MAG: HD domain-containing protein [Clostridia bacterium]|nr:HD domain-containing protein [Clostridia bacterium]
MELFDKAVVFACQKHSGQRRKLSDAPYFLHPMEVAAIVGTMSDDQNLLAAAVLHDTVEDTQTTLQEIEENFGRRVCLLVMTETEDKREDRPPKETWHLRKEETLNIISNTKDTDVKKLWLGDKLSNLRSFCREYRKVGNEFWNRFNQNDPKQQEWYYRTIADALTELSEYDAYREFTECIEFLFGKK